MRSELSTASLRPDLPPVYARVVEVSVDCLPRRSSTKAGRAGALAKADLFHPATPTSELRFGMPTMRQFELLNSHLSRRSFNEGGTINPQLRSSAGASRTDISSARKIEIRGYAWPSSFDQDAIPLCTEKERSPFADVYSCPVRFES
jgi:hypothetical protein